MSPTPCQVLILHDAVDLYLDHLTHRFPQLHFVTCRTDADIDALEPHFVPQVIFSWKSKKISHQRQRQLLLQSEAEWIQIGGAGFDHLQPLEGVTALLTNSAGVLSDFMTEVGQVLS